MIVGGFKAEELSAIRWELMKLFSCVVKRLQDHATSLSVRLLLHARSPGRLKPFTDIQSGTCFSLPCVSKVKKDCHTSPSSLTKQAAGMHPRLQNLIHHLVLHTVSLPLKSSVEFIAKIHIYICIFLYIYIV